MCKPLTCQSHLFTSGKWDWLRFRPDVLSFPSWLTAIFISIDCRPWWLFSGLSAIVTFHVQTEWRFTWKLAFLAVKDVTRVTTGCTQSAGNTYPVDHTWYSVDGCEHFKCLDSVCQNVKSSANNNYELRRQLCVECLAGRENTITNSLSKQVIIRWDSNHNPNNKYNKK